jgi:hypothetical protein
VNLTKLKDPHRPCQVFWLNERFAFTYDPKGYGKETYLEIQKLAKLPEDDPERLEFNNRVLQDMLTNWDLVTDECEAIGKEHRGDREFCPEHSLPINAETLELLPYMLKNRMVTRIMEDMGSDGPGPKSSAS